MEKFKIDVILSPDLVLEDRREQARQKRLAVVHNFHIGQRVKAGLEGYPGILEAISENGFASIRWDDGTLLCGVEVDYLQDAT